MPADVDVKGLLETTRNLERIAADLHGKPMADAMMDAVLLVRNDAIRLAPSDTGGLRASITPEVKTTWTAVTGVVGSNKLYAPYQETGTRPFWPPLAALEVWARRHGTSAFLVARAIARRGIRPKRYLQQAFDKNKPAIKRLIGGAVGKIVKQ